MPEILLVYEPKPGILRDPESATTAVDRIRRESESDLTPAVHAHHFSTAGAIVNQGTV